MTTDYYVRPAALAAELGVPRSTLDTWRAEGKGPQWVRLGDRVIAYRRSEVDRWLADRERAGAA